MFQGAAEDKWFFLNFFQRPDSHEAAAPPYRRDASTTKNLKRTARASRQL